MLRKNKSEKPSRKITHVNRLDMNLTEILREQALRYLPAKALFRSLSVCRDWKLQISTPFFVHNQSVSCRLFSGVFIQSPGAPPSFISLDQMAYGVPDQELSFLPEPVDVKSSTNGLLCCVGRGSDRAYYVCNPVNRHWKKLSKPSNDHGSDPAVALVFEPSVLSFMADFKVICVFASTDIDGAYEFEIYSSDRDSWKLSPEMYFVDSDILYGDAEKHKTTGFQFGRAMYSDGVVYWPTKSYKTLSYDMKKNKATGIPMYSWGPGNAYGYMNSVCLGTVDGKLCTSSIRDLTISVNIIHNRHTNTKSMNALSDGAHLSNKHVYRLNEEIVGSLGNDRPRVVAVCDGAVVVGIGNRFFAYDIKTQETRALLQGGQASLQGGQNVGDPFVAMSHMRAALQGGQNVGDPFVAIPYVNSLVALE